jgi:hypothetical protein
MRVLSFKEWTQVSEAIIDWRTDELEDLESRLREINRPISREQFAQIVSEYGIDVLDYDTFYDNLADENKAGAPPRQAGLFALFNPNSRRPQLVVSLPYLPPPAIAHALHMIKHEIIHSHQAARRPEHLTTGGWNVHNKKEYFSNKDEVMAFSHSVADELLSRGYRTPTDAIHNLDKSMLWKSIRRANPTEDTLNRYRKYIYLYLTQELNRD